MHEREIGVEASSNSRPATAQPARREHVPLAIRYMVRVRRRVRAAPARPRNGWSQTYPVGEVLFTRTALASFIALRRCSSCRVDRALAVYRTRRLGAHAPAAQRLAGGLADAAC